MNAPRLPKPLRCPSRCRVPSRMCAARSMSISLSTSIQFVHPRRWYSLAGSDDAHLECALVPMREEQQTSAIHFSSCLAIECRGRTRDCMRTACASFLLLITVSAADPFPGHKSVDVRPSLHLYTTRSGAWV